MCRSEPAVGRLSVQPPAFPTHTLPWPAAPGNRLAQPTTHPGTHRPATVQPPWLPPGDPTWSVAAAGTHRSRQHPWRPPALAQLRRSDPFGRDATACAGHPRLRDRVHRPGSVLSAALFSPPPREGSAAVPATGGSARAASFAAWHGAGGGRAWGTWGSEDAPSPVLPPAWQEGLSLSPRHSALPRELAGNQGNLEERESRGCRAASPPLHTEPLSVL